MPFNHSDLKVRSFWVKPNYVYKVTSNNNSNKNSSSNNNDSNNSNDSNNLNSNDDPVGSDSSISSLSVSDNSDDSDEITVPTETKKQRQQRKQKQKKKKKNKKPKKKQHAKHKPKAKKKHAKVNKNFGHKNKQNKQKNQQRPLKQQQQRDQNKKQNVNNNTNENFETFIRCFEGEIGNEPIDNKLSKMYNLFDKAPGILLEMRNLAVYFINNSKITYPKATFDKIYLNDCWGKLGQVIMAFLEEYCFINVDMKNDQIRVNLTNCNEYITVFSKVFRHISGKTNICESNINNFSVITNVDDNYQNMELDIPLG